MKLESVQSINPCRPVIQTMSDIVIAHGGDIIAESKEGIGTTFIIKIPVQV